MIVRSVLLSAVAIVVGSAVTAKAGTFTFANTNTIIINDSESPPTAASPYPSTNVVTGLNGSIVSKVTVSLFGFAHTFPSDVDIVLVGPEGQNAIVMSNVGGTNKISVTNIDLTLDDDAASPLPVAQGLVSGTFQPTQGDPNPFLFDFPAPAPTTAQLMGPHLSNFNNTEPDGTWSLYVVDDNGGDAGIITGGWSLTITTTPVVLSIAQKQTNSILSWTNAAAGYTLQASPALSGTWTNVNIAPVDVNGFFTVTNPATASRLFYRLMK